MASFNSKHTIAAHIPTRISLFGGIPESYKDGVPLTKGGVSIGSQTNVPKTKDWETRTSGRCDEAQGQPSTLEGCWALAGNAGMSFRDSFQVVASGAFRRKRKRRALPKGCFLRRNRKHFSSIVMAGRTVPRTMFASVSQGRKQNRSQNQSHLQQNRSQSQSQLQQNRRQRLLSRSILDLIVPPRSELFRNRIAKRWQKNLALRTEGLSPRR